MNARKLTICQHKTSGCGVEVRVRLGQFDLIWNAIDDEKQITLVDDVAVLEADLSERAADLGAQLKMVHGRELPQEFEPAVHVTLQRRADGNLRWRRGNGSTWGLDGDASGG